MREKGGRGDWGGVVSGRGGRTHATNLMVCHYERQPRGRHRNHDIPEVPFRHPEHKKLGAKTSSIRMHKEKEEPQLFGQGKGIK